MIKSLFALDYKVRSKSNSGNEIDSRYRQGNSEH